jgi:hypothetical protein
LPHIPHGPRRSRAARPPARLLACPRISPEWELSAIHALIKPQLKPRILHRDGMQRWNASTKRALAQAAASLKSALGSDVIVHLPAAGDYHFLIEVADANSDEARAWALVVSKALPELWLVAGRLFLNNGRFFRRRYGYKLCLVPATDVHLSRALRAALKGFL